MLGREKMGGEEREGKWEVKVTTKEGTRNEKTRNRSLGWGWGGHKGTQAPTCTDAQ